MEIDYVVEATCEPKRRFGRDGLLSRLRRLSDLRDSGGEKEAAQARESEFELRPLAFHCARCPANFARAAYGCFGTIRCPIPAAAEEWLMGLLPRTLRPRKEPPKHVARQIERVKELIELLRDAQLDGLAVDQEQRGVLLAARRPVVRRYGTLFRRMDLNSSQLLQVLIFNNWVDPANAEILCRALGIWQDEEDPMGGKQVVFTQPIEPDDPPAVADLKEFLLALTIACSLDVVARTLVRTAAETPVVAR